MVSMTELWVIIKITIGGIIKMTATALAGPVRPKPPVEIEFMTALRPLRFSLYIYSIGEAEFHKLVKAKMVRVSHAGRTPGSTIFEKILYSLAPSILAASRVESGIDATINCRTRKTPIVVAR